MATVIRTSPHASSQTDALKFTLPTNEFRSLPIPGIGNSGKLGNCFVRVTDIPEELSSFMEVNPRVPNRSRKGTLSGPVIKGIVTTLTESPEDMALKNQGIYLLVEEATFEKLPGGHGQLTLTLTDPKRHGIVNGGHTYAAIRDTIEASEADISTVSKAYVRLHVLQGIDEDKVAEIAEGLNRSKQVDDPSLANLKGLFDSIRAVMKGKPGESAIAYHQGDDGEIYISEVLIYIALFNCERYSESKHPYGLYKHLGLGLKFFEQDRDANPAILDLLIPRVPEILALADTIRLHTKEAAKRVNFQFGRMKAGKSRAASKKHRNTELPFIGETVDYRVPNGWLFPMLAAFRANVRWDAANGRFEWIVPLDQILPEIIDDLVNVCVCEHRDSGLSPEWIGKRESAYRQCYDKVLLYLARQGKLASSGMHSSGGR